MTNYYKFLNIPTNCFDKGVVSSKIINTDFNSHRQLGKTENNLLTSSFHDWLAKFSYEVSALEVFRLTPNYVGQPTFHVDTDPIEEWSKICFIWGSDNTYMHFGELVDQNISYVPTTTSENTRVVRFNSGEVNEVLSVKIDKPILINVGKPHRASNPSSTPRYNLSICIKHINGGRVLYADAVSAFSEYVLD